MGAALEHAQWTELIGVNEYDHVIGSLLVVTFLVLVSLRVRSQSTAEKSLIPSPKFGLANLFEF